MIRKTSVLLALIMMGIPAARAQSSVLRGTRTTTVSGTIQVRGCPTQAEDLVLRALPAELSDPITGEPRSDPRESHTARITRSSTVRGAFDFVVGGLTRDSAYSLEIRMRKALCGKMLWQAPSAGVVVGGQELAVPIIGYAMRSKLEVLGPAVGREAEAWVSSDHLDFEDAVAGVRSFRWTTNLRGVAGGELQISTRSFPMPGGRVKDPCAPVDLVYHRRFPFTAGQWASIPDVNFLKIVRGRGVDPAEDETDGPIPFDAPFSGERFRPPAERALRRLYSGGPLFVRVVPVDTQGRLMCGVDQAGVAPMALLAKLALEIFGQAPAAPPGPPLLEVGTEYLPPKIYEVNGSVLPVSSGQLCWRVTRFHFLDPTPPKAQTAKQFLDYSHNIWFEHFQQYFNGPTWGQVAFPGMRYCIVPSTSQDSWFESVVSDLADVVSGAVDGIGQMVNYVSYLYEALQDAAVDVAADAIESVGIPCDATCKAALEYGLETGLATMGVPPSIPNFDQLADQGLDYLAAEVAEQTGVPGPVVDLATKKAEEFVKEAVDRMQARQSLLETDSPEWSTRDIGLEPAVLKMHVFTPGYSYTTTPLIILNATGLFLTAPAIQMPRSLPAGGYVIPMVLQPNVAGLAQPPDTWSDYKKAIFNRDQWLQNRLPGWCTHFNATALVPGDVYNFYTAQVAAEWPAFWGGDFFANCGP